MGMIEGLMKAVPAEKSPDVYLQEVLARLPTFAKGSESHTAVVLAPQDFEEAWNTQENLRDTPEIRAKYHTLTQQGHVIYVEVDW